MRFQVPQFVDIEDKIVGPFTLRQFLIYLGAVFATIPLYLVFDLSLFITVAIPIVGAGAAFAHVRIQGKTLFTAIVNAMQYFFRGQLYLWRRTGTESALTISGEEYGAFTTRDVATIQVAARKPRASLAQQAQQLETNGKVITDDVEDPLTANKV